MHDYKTQDANELQTVLNGVGLVCQNCENTFEGDYCNHCGQKRSSRISYRLLASQVSKEIFDLDHGLLFTLKSLLVNPGNTVKSYILGARKKYYSPLKYLFIWTGIYFLLFKANILGTTATPLGNNNHDSLPFSPESVTDYLALYLRMISEHTDLFYLAMVPFLTIVSYLLFRKQQFLYTELLVCYLYVCGQIVFLLLITSLITFTLGKSALPYVMSVSVVAVLYLFLKMHKELFMQSWILTIAKSLTVLYGGQILFGLATYFVINLSKLISSFV